MVQPGGPSPRAWGCPSTVRMEPFCSLGPLLGKLGGNTQIHVAVVQSLSRVCLFASPPLQALFAASHASLSFTTISWSLESVMPSNHLILCCPLLLLYVF